MTNPKSPPLLHGVVLVAGGAVGAGMFALPIASAGAGFIWAVLGLVLVWLMTYMASLVLLEVNATFEAGASFDTLVTTRLGSNWARANNVAITFIMMVLMYAYTTAGASIIKPILISYIQPQMLPSKGVLSVVFALCIGLIVWLGTRMVSRLSTLLLIAMVLAFITANAGLAAHVDLSLLSLPANTATKKLSFVWGTLPVFVTAFACAGLIPSLVKHYDAETSKVQKSLFWGTLASLAVYVIWLATTLGTLNQAALEQTILAGGSTGDLVSSLQSVQSNASITAQNQLLSKALGVFSHFAIITSFLSIGLGLFHFIADRFSWSDMPLDKTKTALITFGPPMVLSFFAPFGFVSAIGYAGLTVVFSFFIVPVMMLKAQRKRMDKPNPRLQVSSVPNALLNGLLIFSGLIIALKLATIFSLLPTFP